MNDKTLAMIEELMYDVQSFWFAVVGLAADDLSYSIAEEWFSVADLSFTAADLQFSAADLLVPTAPE